MSKCSVIAFLKDLNVEHCLMSFNSDSDVCEKTENRWRITGPIPPSQSTIFVFCRLLAEEDRHVKKQPSEKLLLFEAFIGLFCYLLYQYHLRNFGTST